MGLFFCVCVCGCCAFEVSMFLVSGIVLFWVVVVYCFFLGEFFFTFFFLQFLRVFAFFFCIGLFLFG